MAKKLGEVSGYENCDSIIVYRDYESLKLYLETPLDTIGLTPMMVEELLDILKEEFEG